METPRTQQSADDVLERMGDAYCEVDGDWRVQYWNTEMESETGLDRESALGTTIWDALTDIRTSEFDRRCRAAMSTREPCQFRVSPVGTKQTKRTGRALDIHLYPTAEGIALYCRESTPQSDTASTGSASGRERLFETAEDLLCVARFDGYIEELNGSWEDVLGWSAETLRSDPWVDFVHPDDSESTMETVDELTDGERVAKFVNRYRCADGTYRWLSWNAAADAESNRIYCVARDVTSERRHEQELERERDLFRRVQAMANVGAWELDVASGELVWTDEVYRIHGVSPDQFTPTVERGIDFYHPDDRERIERAVQNGVATGEGWNLELRLVTARDEVIWVRAKGDVLFDEDDEPVKIRGTFQDITDQHEQRQQLRESREQLRQIIDALPQCIWLKDDAGTYVLANEASARLHGTTPTVLEGASDSQFASVEDGRDFREDDRAVIESGESRSFVESIRDATGRERVVETQLIPVESVAADEPLLLGIATDITERERQTRDLRERTRHLQQLYEVTATPMSFDEKIRSLLTVGCERVGLDIGLFARIEDESYTVEAAYSTGEESLDGAQFDLSGTYCEMTVAADGVVSFGQASTELERSHPAYEAFGLEAYIGVPVYVDGDLYGTVNFSSTEPRTEPFTESEELFIKLIAEWIEYRLHLRQRERELETARKQLRQIIDTVPEPIFVKDERGVYRLANEATGVVFGVPPDEVEGKSDEEFVPQAAADRIRDDDARLFETGEELSIAAEEMTLPDGTTRTYQTRKIPFEVGDDEKLLLGVSVDITSLKRSEQRLARANEALVRHRDELQLRYSQLEFFDSLLRHDILNSLTVVRGTAELLVDEVTGEQNRTDVQTILEWSDDIVLLVQRVRNVIDVLTGGDTEAKPVDIEAVLDDEVARLSSAYPAATITLDVEDGPLVGADELLGEVLGNLVANAVVHTDTETPVVEVRVDSADEMVRVVVADNGPGVDDDRKETVFRRGETTHVKRSGSGFGLFFVDTMVSAYGGTIVVADNEPRGARFVVELPVYA